MYNKSEREGLAIEKMTEYTGDKVGKFQVKSRATRPAPLISRDYWLQVEFPDYDSWESNNPEEPGYSVVFKTRRGEITEFHDTKRSFLQRAAQQKWSVVRYKRQSV